MVNQVDPLRCLCARPPNSDFYSSISEYKCSKRNLINEIKRVHWVNTFYPNIWLLWSREQAQLYYIFNLKQNFLLSVEDVVLFITWCVEA